MSKTLYVIMRGTELTQTNAFTSREYAAQEARRVGGDVAPVSIGDKGWSRAKQNGGSVFALTIERDDGMEFVPSMEAPLYNGVYPWVYGDLNDAETKIDSLIDQDDDRDIATIELDLVESTVASSAHSCGSSCGCVTNRVSAPARVVAPVPTERRGVPPPASIW